MYELYKLVNGEWHIHGVYNTVSSLANACFELGKFGILQIKVEVNNNA